MKVTLNGETTERYEAPLTVAALINSLGLSGHPVLVELNGEALLPKEFEQKLVGEGAKVELVQIAAGG